MNILDDRGGYRVIITDDNLVAVYDNSYTENVTNKLILLQEIRVAMEEMTYLLSPTLKIGS